MAGKSPAFQFYPGDFLSDYKVACMSMEERGAYTTALCHCWLEDGLPLDDPLLAQYPKVKACFYESDGKYRNKRLDEERYKQTRYSDSQRVNGSSRWGSPERSNKKNRAERLSSARKLGTHTREEFQEMVNFFDGKCVKCGAEGVVADHIIPLYQGGSDSITNLQPLCQPCNAAKGPENTDYRQVVCEEMPAKWLPNACQTPSLHSSSSDFCLPPIVPQTGGRKSRKYWESRVGSQEYIDHVKGKPQ